MRSTIALGTALCLAACAIDCPKPPAPAVPKIRIEDTACSWVKPVTASPDDTLETKREILSHDAALAKNCPR